MNRIIAYLNHRSEWMLHLFTFIIVFIVVFNAMGCAAGRGPAGEVIVGIDIAKLPETAGELANAAAGFLPPPWGTLVQLGAGLLFGGGSVAVAAQRSRRREDAAWDEAERRTYERVAIPQSPPPPIT